MTKLSRRERAAYLAFLLWVFVMTFALGFLIVLGIIYLANRLGA